MRISEVLVKIMHVPMMTQPCDLWPGYAAVSRCMFSSLLLDCTTDNVQHRHIASSHVGGQFGTMMEPSGPECRHTFDHRRSTARPHIACSPAAALASSPPTSSVQDGCASVQSAAWASPTVLWRTTVNSLPLPIAVNYSHLTPSHL